MRFSRLQQHLIVVLCGTAFTAFVPRLSTAQEVTYYDFNTPQANPTQVSNDCSSIAGGPVASGVYFCFNHVGDGLSFVQDSYPPAIDPNANTDSDAGSPNYALQMTEPKGSQASSMWFSIPQDVADGFNVWFSFKLTPTSLMQNPPFGTSNPADGLAFVIQNAAGGEADSASASGCVGSSKGGYNALGGVTGGGGCIGYGGIDNSIALEFDTYMNGWGDPNSNHIALQSCGLGEGGPLPNSPAHNSGCLVTLTNGNSPISTLISAPITSVASPSTSTPVTLADGNPHQIVIVYNGPNDSPANWIYVYLDPTYIHGTHTPVSGTTPLFAGPFNIAQYMTTVGGNAYVGFTAATGSAFETHELMAWTFTPHATVAQQQPLNPPGTQTTANFGTQSYSVTYPQSNTGTIGSNIALGVIANTISPQNFAALIGLGPTQYTGSACQVYDDTGGNCVIYSIYCYDTTSKDVVACPALLTPPIDCSSPSATDCVNVKSAYNNSIAPTSPGYLQGDPLYSPIASISGNGTTATASCVAECAVTQGQTVTILGNAGPPSYNGQIVVQSVVDISHFTFASTGTGTSSGGFLTSNNVQDIFVSYNPQNIDGSTAGKTKNFSDFVVTAVTTVSTQTQLSAATLTPAPAQADTVTATISVPTGPNSLTLLPAANSAIGGTVTFYVQSSPAYITLCAAVPVELVGSSYQATCNYTGAQTGPVTILAQYSGDAYHLAGNQVSLPLNVTGALASVSPSQINFGTLYLGSLVTKTVTVSNTGNTALTISDPLIAIVQGGNSSEFITLNLCPKSLAAGKSCTMLIAFLAGPFYTPQTAILTINDNAPGSPQTVPLSAQVINPQAHLSTGSLSFGTVKANSGSVTKSVTLTNTGGTTLSSIGIGVSGTNAGDFTAGACSASLNPGSSCVISVTFHPSAKGTRTASLVITDNAQNSPQKVTLSGSGN